MNRSLRLLLVTLATIALASCVGIVGTNLVPVKPASTNGTPQVTAVAQQTNGFATNRAVEVQFDTDMNPATINTQTFFLRDANSQLVAGTVSYDQPTRIAGFKAANDLKEIRPTP
jgi:hypothetical protein